MELLQAFHIHRFFVGEKVLKKRISGDDVQQQIKFELSHE